MDDGRVPLTDETGAQPKATGRRRWVRAAALVGGGVLVGGILGGVLAGTVTAGPADEGPAASYSREDGDGDRRGHHRGGPGDGDPSQPQRADEELVTGDTPSRSPTPFSRSTPTPRSSGSRPTPTAPTRRTSSQRTATATRSRWTRTSRSPARSSPRSSTAPTSCRVRERIGAQPWVRSVTVLQPERSTATRKSDVSVNGCRCQVESSRSGTRPAARASARKSSNG